MMMMIRERQFIYQAIRNNCKINYSHYNGGLPQVITKVDMGWVNPCVGLGWVWVRIFIL